MTYMLEKARQLLANPENTHAAMAGLFGYIALRSEQGQSPLRRNAALVGLAIESFQWVRTFIDGAEHLLEPRD